MPYAERLASGMTKVQEEKFLGKVLEEVNDIRSLVDLPVLKKLPKGAIADSMKCPQAVALTGRGCEVSVDSEISIDRTIPGTTIKTPLGTVTYGEATQRVEVRTPKNMSKFIDLFDEGKLPQFIK